MNIITKNISLARLLKQSLAVLLFCEMSSRNLSVSLLSWMSLMYHMSSSSIPILRGLTFSGKNLLKRHQQMSIKKSFDVNQKFVKLLIECHRCVFQPLFFSNTVNIDDYSAGLISVKGVYIQIEPSCWAWPVFSGQSCIKNPNIQVFLGYGCFSWKKWISPCYNPNWSLSFTNNLTSGIPLHSTYIWLRRLFCTSISVYLNIF